MKKEFYIGYSTGFDTAGYSHIVTVMAERYFTKETVWDNAQYIDNNGTTKFEYTTLKERTLNVKFAYAIQNNADKTDMTIAEHVCKRRLNKNDIYLHLTTINNLRGTTIQAMVEAEARYIAANVEKFIHRINENAVLYYTQDNER